MQIPLKQLKLIIVIGLIFVAFFALDPAAQVFTEAVSVIEQYIFNKIQVRYSVL